MQPQKTEMGRLALQSHAAPLNIRERRALILCDGKRDLAELGLLLGPDAPTPVMHLHETGYLAANKSAAAVSTPPSMPATVAAQRIPTRAPSQISLQTPPQPSPPQAGATGTRRSLTGAKLYLVGMLELQRDEAAAVQRRRLMACQDPDAMIAQLLAGLRCLQQVASPSLASRVRDRLGEVLPESLLPALELLDLEHAGRRTT